jgi:tRNA modification GTPase
VADYPEEDIPPHETAELLGSLEAVAADLQSLLDTYGEQGRVLKEGVRCAILGKPNVGKSSLLNVLAGYDRAIVNEAPGTTRDTLEENVRVGGVLLRLTDCAGLRPTQDPVEQQGVDRSRAAAEQAGLLFVVLDASRPLDDDDRWALDYARESPSVILLNKCDLPSQVESEPLEAAFLHVCRVSAITGEGLDYLDSIVRRLFDTRAVCDGSVLTGARQAEAMRATLEATLEAKRSLEQGYTPDAVMGELERAMNALAELTGRAMTEDTLDKIFEEFCVGK